MIVRSTLAIVLALSAAAPVLMKPVRATAEPRLPCRTCSQSRTASSRVSASNSSRTRIQQMAHHRRPTSDAVAEGANCPVTSTGLCDDGLAFDAPRGLPVATPIPLALSTSSRPWQTGYASWYGGPRWQGHMTSSGGRFDENGLTAAHATLPLGSQARVHLMDSDREVIVTITDRPGTRIRVIDLSRGAAAKLGILSQGVARVAVDPL